MSSDPSRAPDAHHTGTCGKGGIRALHADNGKGGWHRFAGAGDGSSVRNLDVDKVGAADSLTGAVVIMVTIVIERIKRPRREEVDGGQLKWDVDKSKKKKNVKGMSRQRVNLKKETHTVEKNR